jgi:hypothetical protein
MNIQSAFENSYWNLAQASAWVEYREKQLVDELAQADRAAYIAISMYPSMWPKGRERRGRIEDLRRALEEGRLISSGFRRGGQERLEDILAAEWADYVIRPPLVSLFGHPNNLPWERVRVLSAEMKRLWRGVNEVEGRSRFNWAAIQKIFNEVKTQNSEMSQNELILEVQGTYEDRSKKNAPSRTAIQDKLKTWS